MAVNSIGDFIKSVFPTLVNKSGKIFKALLADGEGGGTIESIFEDLEETRKAWTENKSIYRRTHHRTPPRDAGARPPASSPRHPERTPDVPDD